MRGNVFGALGSRLGTAIHSGTFTLVAPARHARRSEHRGIARALARDLARARRSSRRSSAIAFGLPDTISVADFVVISVIGGVLSSIVVLVITVGVAGLSARRGWDLDNVSAPIVTAAGDMVTLPALFLATFLVGIAGVTEVVAVLCAVAAVVCARCSRSGRRSRSCDASSGSRCRSCVIAGTIDIVAGLTIEKRFDSFLVYPALLVLVPPFLEDSGSLGAILARGCPTKLHLGTLAPSRRPLRADRRRRAC